MTHPPDDHINDLLPAWLNGTLTVDVQAQVRSHLDDCAACRAELDEWQAIAHATRAFADARQVKGRQDFGGTWATGQSSGGSINANDRGGNLAERSAQEPRISRSAMMIDTVSANTTGRSLASPNGQATPNHQVARRSRVWVSQVLPTLVMMALLVALVGGVYLREFGFPTNFGGGDSDPAPAFSAFQDTLSCDSPGFRPVISGEVDVDTLAAIGITETPLNIDRDQVKIPTSSGEIVTLDNNWTPIGGPMWSTIPDNKPAQDRTIRNIDTGEEWIYPQTNYLAAGQYFPPYLVVPENRIPSDFRIINTETGEEKLISEMRGGKFTGETHVSQIDFNPDSPSWPATAPAVLLFWGYSTQSVVGVEDSLADAGPNVLILPTDLEDAAFAPDTAVTNYSYQIAYAPATDQLAYSTDINGQPAIVVIQPGTDARVVLQHPDFTTDTQPLMFSTDGSMLVATQPGMIFTFELMGSTVADAKVLATFDEMVVPIAHNAASMNILVQYPDKHVSFVNARTGDLTEHRDVLVPVSEFASSDPGHQMSFETDMYDLFDEAAGTVRVVNLVQETITPEEQVLNPAAETIPAAFQPEFYYVIPYPYTAWSGGFAYLDVSGTLEVMPVDSSAASWSVPPPAGFELDGNDVASLFVNPAGTCLVLQVVSAGTVVVAGNSQSQYVATWVLPLAPDAEWTELDVRLTGWFPIAEEPEPLALPALDYGTPVATPGSTPVSTAARMRRITPWRSLMG